MDVDNLGVILSQRISSDLFSPLILSTLSKSFNLFFTIYMNLICKKQIDNPLLIPTKSGTKERFVSIIYSGGDDLVIIGAWNEICEISLDIRRNFKKYVKNNEDTTVKGTICTYDRIVTTTSVKEDYTGQCGVYRFDIIFNLTQKQATKASDHYPVWAMFYVNRDTD